MELRVASELEDESAPWINQLMPHQALHLARAAIRTMREPTQNMKEAGAAYADDYMPETNAGMCWQEMIDAASPPE